MPWQWRGCGRRGDVIAFWQEKHRLSFVDAVKELRRDRGLADDPQAAAESLRRAKAAEEARRAETERRKAFSRNRAVEMWRAGVVATGTPVESAYWPSRGLWVPVPWNIRYLARTEYWWQHPDTGASSVLAVTPAMLTRIDHPQTGRFMGVVVTHLAADGLGKAELFDPVTGEQLKAKKVWGDSWGGAERLMKPGPWLGLGEGRETVLSVHQGSLRLAGDEADGVGRVLGTVEFLERGNPTAPGEVGSPEDRLQTAMILGDGNVIDPGQGGVRDEPRTLPGALFNGRNIVKGSFSIEYVMPGEDTADAVTVEYFDEVSWKIAEVTAAERDGAIRVLTPAEMVNTPPSKPGRVQMFGVTNRAQAGREACFLVACNIYRRRMPIWKTEMDGMILSYGELVAVSHPMPAWGQGGELVDWDEPTGLLTLSEPVRWKDGQAHFIALRRRDGRMDTPVEIEPPPGGDPFQVHVLDPLPFEPDLGGDRERTFYALGPGDTWAQRVLVRSLRPRSRQVEISGVCEDDRVHVN